MARKIRIIPSSQEIRQDNFLFLQIYSYNSIFFMYIASFIVVVNIEIALSSQKIHECYSSSLQISLRKRVNPQSLKKKQNSR